MWSDATDILLREIQADDASSRVVGVFPPTRCWARSLEANLQVNHKLKWSFNDPWGEVWLLYQQIAKGYHRERSECEWSALLWYFPSRTKPSPKPSHLTRSRTRRLWHDWNHNPCNQWTTCSGPWATAENYVICKKKTKKTEINILLYNLQYVDVGKGNNTLIKVNVQYRILTMWNNVMLWKYTKERWRRKRKQICQFSNMCSL